MFSGPPPPSSSSLSLIAVAAATGTKLSDSLWEFFDSRVSKTCTIHSETGDGPEEVKMYLTDAFVPRTHDLLVYWQERCALYLHLHAMKKKRKKKKPFIPAIRVPCKQFFS